MQSQEVPLASFGLSHLRSSCNAACQLLITACLHNTRQLLRPVICFCLDLAHDVLRIVMWETHRHPTASIKACHGSLVTSTVAAVGTPMAYLT